MPVIRRMLLVLGILAFGVLCYLWQNASVAGARQLTDASLAFLPYISGGTEGLPGTPTVPTASVTPEPTAILSVTPSITVTATTQVTTTPTYTPSATSAPGDTGDVRITIIFFDGAVHQAEADEYVEIKNFDTKAIRLQGWKLHDAGPIHTYTFPNYLIPPGESCRVYTNENHPEWCGFNWKNGSAIWNNNGDTATLRDGSGKVISTCSYSGSGNTTTCP